MQKSKNLPAAVTCSNAGHLNIIMKNNRLTVTISALIAAATLAGSAFAQAPAAPVNRHPEKWNIAKSTHLAIGGYDPVAYFPEGGGKAVEGKKELMTEYNGVQYRFATAANKEKFLANPEKYEPAYGGWCAWAMREGDKVEVDPKSFIVKENRLFLFYNGLIADTKAKWLKGNHEAESREADAKWRGLSGEAPRTGAMVTLKSQLDAKKAEYAAKIPPEMSKQFDQGIADVANSGVLASALKVGAQAPMFELPDAKGSNVALASLLKQGPVVVTWYRGAWCPYCNIQLHAYQEALGDIKSAGGQLVAISPQTPDNSMTFAEKQNLEFTVLSDSGNKVAHQFGLAYKLPEAVAKVLGERLAASNGDKSAELPLSATYVLDQSGKVVYAFVDADYRNRAETADVINALKSIKQSK